MLSNIGFILAIEDHHPGTFSIAIIYKSTTCIDVYSVAIVFKTLTVSAKVSIGARGLVMDVLYILIYTLRVKGSSGILKTVIFLKYFHPFPTCILLLGDAEASIIFLSVDNMGLNLEPSS